MEPVAEGNSLLNGATAQVLCALGRNCSGLEPAARSARSVNCLLLWRPRTQGVWACAGCIQRASCLLVYVYLMQHQFTMGSRLRLPWRLFCEVVPMQKIGIFIDQWLFSSGDHFPQ